MGTSPLWTRSELLDLRNQWKAAYRAASTGKSYQIDGRSLTRQDLEDIRAELDYIQQQLEALDGKSGPHFVRGLPAR